MSIILHILCRNIDRLDIWKCTLHSFKGHGATFQGILHFFWIVTLQKHTAVPQRKITLIQKGKFFFFNTAFVGRYGDVVIMLKTSSIFCRNCVLLKRRSDAVVALSCII